MSTGKTIGTHREHDGRPLPTYEEVLDRLVALIAEAEDLDVARIGPESQLERDLGMDSLSIVELQMTAEEAFGVTLPSDVPRTVKDAVAAVLAALAR